MAKLDLGDFVKYGKLFEAYGLLLSSDRQSVMSMYFDYNMTLAEIAKEKGVSRQAVLDTIEKACGKLETFENNLHIVEKQIALTENLKNLLTLANKSGDTKIAEKVEKMLKEI